MIDEAQYNNNYVMMTMMIIGIFLFGWILTVRFYQKESYEFAIIQPGSN